MKKKKKAARAITPVLLLVLIYFLLYFAAFFMLDVPQSFSPGTHQLSGPAMASADGYSANNGNPGEEARKKKKRRGGSSPPSSVGSGTTGRNRGASPAKSAPFRKTIGAVGEKQSRRLGQKHASSSAAKRYAASFNDDKGADPPASVDQGWEPEATSYRTGDNVLTNTPAAIFSSGSPLRPTAFSGPPPAGGVYHGVAAEPDSGSQPGGPFSPGPGSSAAIAQAQFVSTHETGDGDSGAGDDAKHAVPEPAAIILLGLGMIMLAVWMRKR